MTRHPFRLIAILGLLAVSVLANIAGNAPGSPVVRSNSAPCRGHSTSSP